MLKVPMSNFIPVAAKCHRAGRNRMCATSLGWLPLVNFYGVKAGWLIPFPFVDKRVDGS